VITNLDTDTYNTKYEYSIVDEEGIYPYTYNGEFCNLFPFYTNGYQNCNECPQHACPQVNYVFPLDLGDSALFRIDHVILGDFTPVDTIGDTLTHFQRFYNYFAYDDGTPEEGYGLTPFGAKLAYKFHLNVKDTLRAVQMYFNHTQDNANQQFFNLKVWRDNNGVPGDEIYSQESERVEYSTLTNFHTYMLDDPILVNGIFYIGWEQSTPDNLNIGFDKNNNAQANIFYNATGEWLQTTFQGALLMRPLLGDPFEITGIDENSTSTGKLKIFPNPANGNSLDIELPEGSDPDDVGISIYSVVGQRVVESSFNKTIDISTLTRGMYIVRLVDAGSQKQYTAKLIISRP
jgi:hypothetical protein